MRGNFKGSEIFTKADKGVLKIYRNMHRVPGWGGRDFFHTGVWGGNDFFTPVIWGGKDFFTPVIWGGKDFFLENFGKFWTFSIQNGGA